MAMARVIDGQATALALRTHLHRTVIHLTAAHGVRPGLAVVLVGDDAASHVYVRNKERATREACMASFVHRLPADTSEAALLGLIARLNADAAIHGILVQLPLPPHLRADVVLEAINPAKDVDGFHPINVGRLTTGLRTLVPCTPQGALILLRTERPDLTGLRALVLGRSTIVGRPMAQLLLAADCTVTVAHSRTRDLADECRRADILIAAVGRPHMVRGDWIKPGALVIDVGINRIKDTTTGKIRLVGDVAYAEALENAAAITPVPGGVGPMTIACLLRNTLVAACQQSGITLDLDAEHRP